MAENESAGTLFQPALDSGDVITSEMLSGEHLLWKIDGASNEPSQKHHVRLCLLRAEHCHVGDPKKLADTGPAMGYPTAVSQAWCCVIPLPRAGFLCSQPGNEQLLSLNPEGW